MYVFTNSYFILTYLWNDLSCNTHIFRKVVSRKERRTSGVLVQKETPKSTMSKNTGASKFRKVNVDEYDEENFQDNEDTDVSEVGPNENEVVNYLNQCILL